MMANKETLKPDCFAFRATGCSVLNEKFCEYKECWACKTKEQFDIDRDKQL